MSDITEEMGGYMGDGSEIEAAMTPQKQPDSQAGDEVDRLYGRYWHSEMGGQEFKQAIRAYAERLAAKRAIEELQRLIGWENSETLDSITIGNRIKELEATLTKEKQ